jgi:uncharacterized protein (TIGR02646 family)
VIYVAKPRRLAPPKFLAAAIEEMRIVMPLFASARRPLPKFKYEAYRTPTLVAILERLFNSKCAYCEASYAATGYVEIEHYRPKNIYYWLAADWANLLPSCKKCNNGKMSKFPLKIPNHRATRPGQERREVPLLLNPSDPLPSRRPEKHLRFNSEDGAISAVLVRGKESELGAMSITVYRLSRKELSDPRRDWARRVEFHIEACKWAQRSSAAARERAEQGLHDLLAPCQPFRALTIQILRENGVRLPTRR